MASEAFRTIVAGHDPQIMADLCAQLSRLGHEVISQAASCAQVALLAQEQHPDLVIVDIGMPGSDELQACSRLSERCPCAMIVLGEPGDHDLVHNVTQMPILGYLVKPVREQELDPAIELAVARFTERQQLQGQLDRATQVLDILTVIKRATTYLASERHCTPQEAGTWLQQEARAKRAQLFVVAQSILQGKSLSYFYDVPI
jgi:AmiR/NasT family two-component response regulator